MPVIALAGEARIAAGWPEGTRARASRFASGVVRARVPGSLPDICRDGHEKAPACAGAEESTINRKSEAVEDLVGPEPLEAMQRLVEADKLLGIDAPDLLPRAHVLLVERLDRLANPAAPFREV